MPAADGDPPGGTMQAGDNDLRSTYFATGAMRFFDAMGYLFLLSCIFACGHLIAQAPPGPINPQMYPGADLCLQIQAAISANASAYPQGLIIDARSATGIQQCSVNPFAGATVPGQLLLGMTVLKTTAPIVTPSLEQWQILGVGRGRLGGNPQVGTSIQAVTGFPINGKVVRLGDGSALTFGNRIENLAIDCNSIAGTIGLYSSDIQEESGGSNLVITRCPARSLWINGSGSDGVIPFADNYDFHDVEGLALEASNSSHIACEFDGNTATQGNGPHIISGLTCSGTGTPIGTAFVFDGISASHISNLNAEGAATGYLIGNVAPVNAVTIDTMRGARITQDLVHIKLVSSGSGNVTQSIALNNILNSDATAPVTLQDDILGTTLTDFAIGSYGIGTPTTRPGGGYTHLSSAPATSGQLSQLTSDNGSDQDNIFRLGSGNTGVHSSIIELDDRGNPKWNFGKETSNSFQIFDIAAGAERLFAQTASSTFLSSAGSASVLLNLSSASGTGGTVFGSGGVSPVAVASVDASGNGSLASVGITGSGSGSAQSSIVTFFDHGNPKWNMGKETTNSFQLFDFVGGVERFFIQPAAATSISSAGNAPILLNVNNGSGTGGVIFGAGGSSSTGVASVTSAGEGIFTSLAISSLGASTRPLCTTTNGLITNVGCSSSSAQSVPTNSSSAAVSPHALASSLGTGVASVFGRSGDIAAATGDYQVSQIAGAAPLDSPLFSGSLTAPSIGGVGTTAFTLNPASLVESGATVDCAPSHLCDSFSGTVLIKLGSLPTIASEPVLVTVRLPMPRQNLPNCVVSFLDEKTGRHLDPIIDYPDAASLALTLTSPLSPEKVYRMTYLCGGV